MKLLFTVIILTLLAISIGALIIAARPKRFDVTTEYVKFPLLEQGTSFYVGASIGVSASDNFNILNNYMVNKKAYVAAFYHDDTTNGTSPLALTVIKSGISSSVPLTYNAYDLMRDEISQDDGSSFQYRYGVIDPFTSDMTFTLTGLSTNVDDSKDNNFTVLINNSDFDDPNKVLKEKDGQDFSVIAFGKRYTLDG